MFRGTFFTGKSLLLNSEDPNAKEKALVFFEESKNEIQLDEESKNNIILFNNNLKKLTTSKEEYSENSESD